MIKSDTSLIDSMLEGPPAAHPHLSPINARAFTSDHATAMRNLDGLMAYQRFLADARAVKARRRRVSPEFERNVQRQSRQALADLDGFLTSALGTVGQVNQTDIWQTLLQRAGAALDQTGPMTVQDLWRDVRARPAVMAALAEHGLTESVAAEMDRQIATANATLSSTQGRVTITAPLGPNAPDRTITLQAARPRPTSVAELLGRPSFDQLAAAFARGDQIIAAAPPDSPLSCNPGEIVAYGALAARQMMVDHVRKLEDTGLAIHAGGGPTVLVGLLIAGLVCLVFGSVILYACREGRDVGPPDEVCTVGWILVIIGIILATYGSGSLLVASGKLSGEAALILGFAVGLNLLNLEILAFGLGFEAEQVPGPQPAGTL